MKLTVESEVSNHLPLITYTLLTEIAKLYSVDIWVTKPKEEVEIDHPDEDFLWGV